MTLLDSGTRRGAVASGLTGAQLGIVHAQLVEDDPALFTVGELVHLTVAADAPELHVSDVVTAVTRAVAESGLHGVRIVADGVRKTVGGEYPGPVVEEFSDPAAVREWADARIAQGLPLGADPLHEQRVLRLGPRHVVWFTAWHHVLVDGWGVGLVVRRVTELLAASRTGAEPAGAWFTPAADVLQAERDYLDSSAHGRDAEFWATGCGSDDAVRGFGVPAGRHAEPLTRTGTLTVTGAALDAAAERFGATWADLAVATQLLLLARVGGRADVVLGVPLMNRTGSTAALCPTTVVNVLPLAAHVAPGASVGELVATAVAGLRGLRRHGRFRAEELARRTGRLFRDRPLVGAELNLKTFDHPEAAADVAVAVENLSEGPVDDLSVSVQRSRDGVLRWSAQAPAGVLSGFQVESVLAEFGALLSTLTTADPGTPVGQLRGTADSGSATPAVPVVPAVDALRDSVSAHPDRTALVDGDTRWTYAELAVHVAGAAALLRERTAVAAPVALDLPRGAEGVAAYLGCLVAGRTAVPFDPDWPARRRDALLERLGPDAFRLDAATLAERPTDARLAEFAVPPPGTSAYVIHTSGSTGAPKAVLVTHGAFAAFLAHHRATTFAPGRGVVPDRGLRVAQTLPFVFDGSWDTLQGLFSGHEVHLLPRAVVQDPAATVAAVRARRLEFVDTTPTVAGALLDAGLLDPEPSGRAHGLRILTVGGEACPPPLWARLIAEPGLVVRNLYGPTEATVDALGLEGEDAAHGGTPIGRPVHGLTARVLDPHLQPVPAGFAGELHLAGPQLALGYRGAGGLTAARFVADPWGPPGSRTYRTGDLVALRQDGFFDYLGRADRQVKVRGYRVEPAEVEAGLRELPEVRQAAVLVRSGRLTGYVVAPAGTDPHAVRAAAAAVLPDHLVPAVVVVLDDLPRTSTGKLDLTALPAPEQGAATGRAPRGPAETAWAQALADALGLAVGDVDAETDFFALGGDSITAIRTVAGFRTRGFASSVSQVFALRTLAAIAAAAGPVEAAAPAPVVPQFDADQLSRVQDLIARRTRRPGGPRA